MEAIEIDRCIEAESQQRHAVRCQSDDHGDPPEHTVEDDTEEGQRQGTAQQARAVHGPRIRAAPDDPGYALGGGAVESRTMSVGSSTMSSRRSIPSSASIMSSNNDAARRPISSPDWLIVVSGGTV